MKKLLQYVCAFVFVCCAGILSAYNPPVAGDKLFFISSPFLLTNGADAAGGPFLDIHPSSIIHNPSVTAFEQRISLDAGASLIHDDRGTHRNGGAFEAGLLVPGDLGVVTAIVEGVFTPMWDVHLGKSINTKIGFAKDITPELCLGASAGFGWLWGAGKDWSFLADIGAMYMLGSIGPLQDIRIGASVLNIGKTYNDTDVIGLKRSGKVSFPSFARPVAGIAASLYESASFKCAASLDISMPLFQYLLLDTALQMEFSNMFVAGISWYMNTLEFAKDVPANMPSLTFGVKFNVNSGRIFASNTDWARSDLRVDAAWQRLYKHVDVYSAGALLKLGSMDTTPPEIIVW